MMGSRDLRMESEQTWQSVPFETEASFLLGSLLVSLGKLFVEALLKGVVSVLCVELFEVVDELVDLTDDGLIVEVFLMGVLLFGVVSFFEELEGVDFEGSDVVFFGGVVNADEEGFEDNPDVLGTSFDFEGEATENEAALFLSSNLSLYSLPWVLDIVDDLVFGATLSEEVDEIELVVFELLESFGIDNLLKKSEDELEVLL